MRWGRTLIALAALVLFVAACSDDDAGSTAGDAPGDGSGTTGSDATTIGTSDEPYDEWEFIATYEFDPNPPPPESDLGAVDIPLVERLRADVADAGVDLTGIDIFVFDVIGTDDRLFVMDIGRAGPIPEEQGDDEPDIVQVLSESETFQEAGITRLVVNLFVEDETGSYILNSTVPFEELIANSDEDGIDADSLIQVGAIQILDRDGVPTTLPEPDTDASSSTTSSTTTTEATTTTLADEVILIENFDDAPTTAEPLFGPGVMSLGETEDGTLAMTVFTSGVIPAMYPDPVPADVIISFDINPTPVGDGTAFGALVLSEDPSDGILNHYVVVWAGLSDDMLAILPFDNATGGFGDPVFGAIPPEVGWEAGEWTRLTVEIRDGAISASLNFVPIAEWSGPTPVVTGHWGPVILGANPGDAMQIDNVLVREATE